MHNNKFFTLIIAENTIPLITMALSLMQANMRFHSVESFQEAVEELKHYSFNAILIDVSGDSGVEYARQLRALHGAANHVPKITIVSPESEEIVNNVKTEGGTWRLLPSPIDTTKLLNALNEFAGGTITTATNTQSKKG